MVVLVHQVGYAESLSDRFYTFQICFPFIEREFVELAGGDQTVLYGLLNVPVDPFAFHRCGRDDVWFFHYRSKFEFYTNRYHQITPRHR